MGQERQQRVKELLEMHEESQIDNPAMAAPDCVIGSKPVDSSQATAVSASSALGKEGYFGVRYAWLRGTADYPIDYSVFGSRATKVLRALGCRTWGDLAVVRRDDLEALPGVGPSTVSSINASLGRRSAERPPRRVTGTVLADSTAPADDHQLVHDPASTRTSTTASASADQYSPAPSRRPGDSLAKAESAIAVVVENMRSMGAPFRFRSTVRLEATANFGAEQLGHMNLGQTLDWVHENADQLPDAVADEIAELRKVPLQELGYEIRTFGQQFTELREHCHQWKRFSARSLAWPRPTYRELGDQFGVSHEAIRRGVERDAEIIQSKVEGVAPGLANARDGLRELFGIAVPVDGAEDCAWRESTSLDGHPELESEFHALLLWLAGYEQYDGYWALDREHAAKAAQDLAAKLEGAWLVAEDELAGLGLSSDALSKRSEWRDIGDGWFVCLDGSATKKAERVLALTLRPMTAEELVAALDDGTTRDNLANQLAGSDVLCRVDKHGSVAPVEWGLEEYSGISEEIRQRIERGGGRASVTAIISEFTTTFGVSESSVRSYLKGVLFSVKGDVVSLVEDPAANFKPRNPGTVKSSALTDAGWGQWLTVAPQHLDGYSFTVNFHIAAANGLAVGADLLVRLWIDHQFAQDEVSVIWRASSLTGVDVGRARQALIDRNIKAGAELVVVPTREGVHIFTAIPTTEVRDQPHGTGAPDAAVDFLFG